MRLLIVTPEVSPFGQTGSIGDTCAALAKTLVGREHEVVVLSPLHGAIDPAANGLGRRLRKIEVGLSDERSLKFTVFEARTAAGVDLVFLGQEELFQAAGEDDGVSYGAFARAAIEVIRADDQGFDVVHCHGWHTALVPVLIDLIDLDVASVLTVHDTDAEPRFGPELIAQLDLPASLNDPEGLLEGEHVSFLKGGVADADRVATVSGSYARALREESPLTSILEAREDDVQGITGGIDSAHWNPATDAHLEARFDPMDLAGKRRCKVAFQEECGLPVRDDVPLIVTAGELSAASGLDALARTIARIMRADAQLVVVAGEGADASLSAVLREHAKRWPDRLALIADADAAAEHRAFGAADAVLLAPTQPPGSAVAMRAQRYGALPIGPRVHAIADTVTDCDANMVTGNGFLYSPGADAEVLAAVQRAIAAFAQPEGFERVRGRALRADHSWERAAYLYERIYAAL